MTANWEVAYPRLLEILTGTDPVRVLVVGDLILDRYIFGSTSRVSPEAPVAVLREERSEERLGGAGNVLANLAGLGAQAWGVGVIGGTAEGERLAALLGGLGEAVRDPQRPTTVKTRAFARGQQVLRVDRESTVPISGDVEDAVIALAEAEAGRCGAVLISDYGKGVCTPRVIERVLGIAEERGIPIVVDPKGPDWSRYRGASVLTPNQAEAESAFGAGWEEKENFRRAVRDTIESLALEGLVVTRGAAGISFFERGGGETHVPAQARAVYDVTGAGDTVSAAIAFSLAEGAGLQEAVAFANLAAGIVVGKVGAVPISRAEIVEALGGPGEGKVLGGEELQRVLQERHRRGETIVFTNGCFDILHVGHVRLLRFARSLGDCLLVGINTDHSVRAGKGNGRPVLPEGERAELVAGLDPVDHVTLFDEETPAELIERVRPDVLVKGADYQGGIVVGREFVESYGGTVVLAPIVDGVSTTAIIEKIRDLGARVETR